MSSVKRSWISDVQREILIKFYSEGMVGTGVIYKQKINKAVIETGLIKAQVELGNLYFKFYSSFLIYFETRI